MGVRAQVSGCLQRALSHPCVQDTLQEPHAPPSAWPPSRAVSCSTPQDKPPSMQAATEASTEATSGSAMMHDPQGAAAVPLAVGAGDRAAGTEEGGAAVGVVADAALQQSVGEGAGAGAGVGGTEGPGAQGIRLALGALVPNSTSNFMGASRGGENGSSGEGEQVPVGCVAAEAATVRARALEPGAVAEGGAVGGPCDDGVGGHGAGDTEAGKGAAAEFMGGVAKYEEAARKGCNAGREEGGCKEEEAEEGQEEEKEDGSKHRLGLASRTSWQQQQQQQQWGQATAEGMGWGAQGGHKGGAAPWESEVRAPALCALWRAGAASAQAGARSVGALLSARAVLVWGLGLGAWGLGLGAWGLVLGAYLLGGSAAPGSQAG